MNISAVFIAFQEVENLGIGYMSSVLSESNYSTRIIDFKTGRENILVKLQKYKPILVGFSVIFEHHIYEFRDLVEYLRNNGIRSHFTAGGHYASMRVDDLFTIIPSLDSIVMFEGEHTILELVNHICSGENWKSIIGLSYQADGVTVKNPLRPLEINLDNFPFPDRTRISEYSLGVNFATLLAGRGCVYNCSFCDIKEFYGKPPGPLKRIREPGKVVDEIEYLYSKKNCKVFLFQDDDFPVITKAGSGWVKEFCNEMNARDLVGSIMWKINCRPDEVDYDNFSMMKDHGLFKVFLGIEDGTEGGLASMNKQISVAGNTRGLNVLKKLNIGIDFGFMLFQPSTTYLSLLENIDYLESICGDGYMPVTFLKMKPYFGTRVERDLRSNGRIKGNPGFFDYSYSDNKLDCFEQVVFEGFSAWLTSPDGLVNVAKWARNHIAIYSAFYKHPERCTELIFELENIVSEINRFIISAMRELLSTIYSENYLRIRENDTRKIMNRIDKQHGQYLERVTEIIGKVEMLVLTESFFMA
ncbi:MAG: radical SAM protein [Bacteroidia bacterium]|nr:MAG: radical SAM protein [Bacteroidia bacterium]